LKNKRLLDVARLMLRAIWRPEQHVEIGLAASPRWSCAVFDDSPTTQMRQRRAANSQISLTEPGPQHEPLTAARGILLGVFAGGVIIAVTLASIRAVWRMLG
jgi:hypothetical protein